MTLQEFEQWYADNSGTTVESLHAHNQHGSPCSCGDAYCVGWQMVTRVEELEVAPKLDMSEFAN